MKAATKKVNHNFHVNEVLFQVTKWFDADAFRGVKDQG